MYQHGRECVVAKLTYLFRLEDIGQAMAHQCILQRKPKAPIHHVGKPPSLNLAPRPYRDGDEVQETPVASGYKSRQRIKHDTKSKNPGPPRPCNVGFRKTASLMPKGKRYELSGSLLKDNRPTNLILQCDDGGVWRLDVDTAAWRLVGQRVQVIGFRADFDILDVHAITPI